MEGNMSLLDIINALDGNFSYNSYSQSHNQVWSDHTNFGYGWDTQQEYFPDERQDTQQIPYRPEVSHYDSGTSLEGLVNIIAANTLEFHQDVKQYQQNAMLRFPTLEVTHFSQETESSVQNLESQQNSGTSLEDLVMSLVTNTQQFQQETISRIQNLANQLEQIEGTLNRIESQSEELPSQPEMYLRNANTDLWSEDDLENVESNIQGIACVKEVDEELKSECEISFSSEVSTESIIIFEIDPLPLPSRLKKLNEEEKGEDSFELFQESEDSVEMKNMRKGKTMEVNDYQPRPYPEESEVEEPHVTPEDHNFVT